MSYEDWQSKIPQAPPWFLGPRGRAWLRAHGKIKDLFVGLAKQAAKVGLPSYAPLDALPEIGKERQLDRGPTETDSAYRLRLGLAWDLWPKAGTHAGILLELKAQGFPMGTNGAHIVQHNGRFSRLDPGDVVVFGDTMTCVNRRGLDGSLPGNLPGFTLHGDEQFYARFAIVFPVNVPTLRPGTSQAFLLQRTAQRWRPAKMRFVGAFVMEAGPILGWPLSQPTLGGVGAPVLGTSVTHFIPPA